jgi:hypothetical protein
MSKAIYFYSQLTVPELQTLVEAHLLEFDTFLEDTFTDEELGQFEAKLDTLAALYVQPVLHELSFDDFYPDPSLEEEQRSFFQSCRSSISIENLPDFETNPFQVTYLLMLASCFDEVLIDPGGVEELCFKQQFIDSINEYKSLHHLTAAPSQKKVQTAIPAALEPIDFLVLDVYKELERVTDIETTVLNMTEKEKIIFYIMKNERLGAGEILRKSCLIPKDFGDSLERLKFFLKKLP